MVGSLTSSLGFTQLKARATDRLLSLLEYRPNRIDGAACVSPLAYVARSRLYGPVEVAEYARLVGVQLSGPIAIGRYASLWGPRIYVDAREWPVVVGNFCSIARDVSFHGYGHDPQRISTHYIGRNLLGRPLAEEIVSRGEINVGHDVWIGAGAQVMSGVTIGTGAVIGAGAIVTRDIPEYAIAVGAPARPVGARFDEATIARLLASEWWTWSREEIALRSELFTQPLTRELLDAQL